AELAAAPAGPAAAALAAFARACRDHAAALRALASTLPLDEESAFGAPAEDGYLERARGRLAAAAKSLPRLRAWCALQRDAQAAARLGLLPLVAALTAGAGPAAQRGRARPRAVAPAP